VKEEYETKFWDGLIQEDGRDEIEMEKGLLLVTRIVGEWMKRMV
jgi:hypothetical protein